MLEPMQTNLLNSILDTLKAIIGIKNQLIKKIEIKFSRIIEKVT